ncbi:MAG TPA: hypothetical protein VN257_00725 [Actinotalea sp.]|nr:hypothetical protein [Actinotalea sp.]
MVKDPIRSHEDVVGETVVRTRTGRSRAEWFALLDIAGAADWTHGVVARWLVDQGVDGWWAQSLTVGYEQSRGRRTPGQRPDGTFEVSTSVTLRTAPDRALALLTDPELRGRWLDVVPEVRTSSVRRVHWTWADGSRVTVHLYPVQPDRVRVSVQHHRLPDGEHLAELKAYWTARLAALKAEATDAA